MRTLVGKNDHRLKLHAVALDVADHRALDDFHFGVRIFDLLMIGVLMKPVAQESDPRGASSIVRLNGARRDGSRPAAWSAAINALTFAQRAAGSARRQMSGVSMLRSGWTSQMIAPLPRRYANTTGSSASS